MDSRKKELYNFMRQKAHSVYSFMDSRKKELYNSKRQKAFLARKSYITPRDRKHSLQERVI